MDFSDYLLALFGAGVTAVGWFAKTIWSDHNETRKEFANYKVYVSDNYVKHDRLKEIMQPIMDALTEIKDTLKTKADK
jgi:hypothetical protein